MTFVTSTYHPHLHHHQLKLILNKYFNKRSLKQKGEITFHPATRLPTFSILHQ